MKKVLKFYASWCAPCRAYAPVFEKVSNKFENQIEIRNINIDEDSEGLAGLYKVRSIPCTVLIKEDGTVISKTGALSEVQVEELFLS